MDHRTRLPNSGAQGHCAAGPPAVADHALSSAAVRGTLLASPLVSQARPALSCSPSLDSATPPSL